MTLCLVTCYCWQNYPFMLHSWKGFSGEKYIFRFNSYSTFSGWVLKQNYPQMGTHINPRHRRLDARRAFYHQFHQFLIAWVPTVKLDMFTRQTFGSKVQPQKSALLGHTYHWIQLAKRMEYWQKFSFITSFSKGLIGYSLRYLGEREAAECMSGVCRLGLGSAERSAGGGAEDQANRKWGQRRRRRGLHLQRTS